MSKSTIESFIEVTVRQTPSMLTLAPIRRFSVSGNLIDTFVADSPCEVAMIDAMPWTIPVNIH